MTKTSIEIPDSSQGTQGLSKCPGSQKGPSLPYVSLKYSLLKKFRFLKGHQTGLRTRTVSCALLAHLNWTREQ